MCLHTHGSFGVFSTSVKTRFNRRKKTIHAHASPVGKHIMHIAARIIIRGLKIEIGFIVFLHGISWMRSVQSAFVSKTPEVNTNRRERRYAVFSNIVNSLC